MRFVDLLLFPVCQNDASMLTKRKSAAIEINSYLSSAANCVNFFFDLQRNEIDKWRMPKYLRLCGTL